MRARSLGSFLLMLAFLAPAYAVPARSAGPEGRGPVPARAPAPGALRPQAAPPQDVAAADLGDLLRRLGERARAYETVALKFVCIESIRSSEDSRNERRFDYMYVEAQEQRYRPYRQIHTGRLGRSVAEANVDFNFPDAYSWTLMFTPDRQDLFRFKYAGQEWFSLRQAHILEFTASLPFTAGRTIYEWSGKVWADAENYNILKVEAEPGNQSDRLRNELRAYRQAPRFLIYPIGKRPRGLEYNITFLNELHNLSLPDQVDVRTFTLNLQGEEEWESQTVLRYSGYQFFGVDVRDLFQITK